jgi:hypothetical protein
VQGRENNKMLTFTISDTTWQVTDPLHQSQVCCVAATLNAYFHVMSVADARPFIGDGRKEFPTSFLSDNLNQINGIPRNMTKLEHFRETKFRKIPRNFSQNFRKNTK